MAPSLNSLLPDTSLGTGAIDQLGSAFSGVVSGNMDNLPISEIKTLTNLFSSSGGLASPEKLIKQGGDILSGLGDLFPGDAGELIKTYSDELAKLERFIETHPIMQLIKVADNFQDNAELAISEMTNLADQFKSLKSASPDDIDISQIITSLQQLIGKITTFVPQVDGEDFSGSIVDFLKDVADGVTGWVTLPPIVKHTLRSLENVDRAIVQIDLAVPYQQLQTELAQLPATLQTLDVSDASARASLEAQLAAVEAGLSTLSDQFSQLSKKVGPIVLSIDLTKYKEALGAFVGGMDKLVSKDGFASLSDEFDLGDLIHQVHEAFSKLDVSQFTTRMNDFIEKLDPLLEKLDPSIVTEPLNDQLAELGTYLDSLEKAKIAVTIEIRKCFETVTSQIESVDFGTVRTTIEAALNGLKNTVGNQVAAAISAINDGFESVFDALETAVQQVQNLISGTIKTTLEGGIEQIKTALDTVDLAGVLESAETQLNDACEQLENLDFSLVIDPVIEDIDEIKDKLAQIDLSVLNDFLKISLKGAVEIFKGIDFETDISAALVGQLDDFKQLYKSMIEEIQGKVEQALATITAFKPETLLSAADAPFDTLKDKLSEIKPSRLFYPLIQAHESCIETLNDFDPEALLAPLSTLIDGLWEKLDALKPSVLLAPLQERINNAFSLLDKLDIDAVLGLLKQQCKSSLGGIQGFPLADIMNNSDQIGSLFSSTLLSAVDTEKIKNYFEQKVLAPLNTFLGALEVNILFPIFHRLHTHIAVLSPATLMDKPDRILQSVDTALNQLNLTDAVTQLYMDWQSATQAVAALDASADPAFCASITLRVSNLSPMDRFSSLTASIDYIHSEALKKKNTLLSVRNEYQEKLNALYGVLEDMIPDFAKAPDAEAATDTFNDELSASIPANLSTELNEIIEMIKQLFNDLQLSNLFPSLQTLNGKLQQKVKDFTDLDVLFAPLQDLVKQFKDQVKSFVDLSFITDELDGVFNTVKDKLSTLDPSSWTAELSATYAALLSELNGLDFESKGQELDGIYNDQVLAILDSLRPSEVLLPPLKTLFADVESILNTIAVDDLFDALLKVLDTLFDQLEGELEKTEKSFKDMISAVPV